MAGNENELNAEPARPAEEAADSLDVAKSADVNGLALGEARKIAHAEDAGHDNNGVTPKPENDFTSVTEAEGQQKKLPYPKSVFFIISNEFCERFNYYGMRTVLVLYLSRQLGYSDDTATVIFHIFTMFVYFLCIFGAIISDSWLGKFKTILYLSLVYICGSVMLTLGAIGPLNMPVVTFTMIGLALVALGSGGIKPCVSAFGGDQFKLPEQIKQMTTFFSLFYFSINAGSLISTTVTPILREDVHCFGEKECYSLAFGVPAVLMAISIVIFVLGRPMYKSKPPAGNMVVLVSKTIGTAISTKWKEKKTNPLEHWLDYADKKYDKQLIEDVKVLMRVLFLYLPLPVFWALFDQQGSRWTFQATRMDGDMGSWDIKPDQLQVLNPLLILIFIPLYDVAFYPALSLIGIRRPLQKLTLGGILAGIAFIISGVVELQLEKTYPVLPYGNNAQLRFFNAEDCTYTIETNLPNQATFTIDPLGMQVNYEIYVPGTFELSYTITSSSPTCYDYGSGNFQLKDRTAWSLFLNQRNDTSKLFWQEDFVNKPSTARPLVRTVANTQQQRTIIWRTTKGSVDYEGYANETALQELTASEYEVLVDGQVTTKKRLRTGGVYTLIVVESNTGAYKTEWHEVTAPNSMSILWLIPQYVVMTLGEVMFSVTGLEFSYSQAPVTMKSVLQACWLLTVAVGNVIVVIIAEAALFDSQASEFFLFAGLMFADMLLFMFMAMAYKPNNPMLQTYPVTPSAGYAQLRIFSGVPDCAYNFSTNLPDDAQFSLQGIDYYERKFIPVENGSFQFNYVAENIGDDDACPDINGGSYTLLEAKAFGLFLRPAQTLAHYWYEDRVEKSSKAKPLVRTLANRPAAERIVWRESTTGSIVIDESAKYTEQVELRSTEHDVLIDDVLVHGHQKLRHGGVYTLVIGASNVTVTRMFEVTAPNSMSILWLIPQYVVMTLGEVMFSVTGLEFSYSQAPVAMKSVLQACWLLTVAFGNVIVVVIAELKFFNSQASEFFLFAGLMLIDMLIFMWMAYNYIPNELAVAKCVASERVEMIKSDCDRASSDEPKPPRYIKFNHVD